MLTRFFIKKGGKPRLSPQARALLKIADINMSSANCTLIQTASGETEPEDLGRILFFKNNGQLMIQDRALFITTPEGIKAETQNSFQGSGDILSLWFLHERVPRVIECRVEERIRFPAETLTNIDPKVGIGYKLTPLSDVLKQDKRSSLRFSHHPGMGALPVYPQILFDLFVCKTDQAYPTEGAVLPRIENPRFFPPDDKNGYVTPQDFTLVALVQAFKQAMRGNPSEYRTVYVSKPYLEEKLNRSILIELGFSDVLGLGSEDIGRNLHIKKPVVSWIKDRRDPHYLTVNDTLVLHYGARARDGHYDYYELITEISKGGLENLTIRPLMDPRKEGGLKVPLIDFCVNGIRFENSPEFLGYALGKNYRRLSVDQQMEALHDQVLLFNFYPRLRFNRETDPYRPDLPARISILGRIVRSDVEWDDEEDEREGDIRYFGVKFMYDPVEYSRDAFLFDQWEMIRPFKENRYFKEVHKSLNGLIAYLESQSKD